MNNNIKIGDKLEIHCYKHNGKLHRQWDEAVVLDIKEDYIVFGNDHTNVIDSDGKVWKTKEPAIMFFFKNRWFNIIGQLKDYGIYFYCNIATPFLIDENVIKYIDYDLDLRVFPNGSFKILDRMEYVEVQSLAIAILTSIITGGFVLVFVEIGNKKHRDIDRHEQIMRPFMHNSSVKL